MGKRGPKSRFAEPWGTGETELFQCRVPAGFMSMLEKYAAENGTSCSSAVRYSVLKEILGEFDANRLEPMELRNSPNRVIYTGPILPGLNDDSSENT